jgi:hypothetical protein
VGSNQRRRKLAGTLNEDVNFGVILRHLQAGLSGRVLIFDVQEIEAINSAGAREWLLFLERLQRLVTFRFEVVSEALVSNSIITPGFLGSPGTPVKFFAMPYFCPDCDARVDILANTEDFPAGKPFKAPAKVCDTCGGTLEFDSLDSEYTVFLNHTHAAG